MGDVNVSLQLWDVDGTAISGKMLETYVHDANAIIFVYDVTKSETFNNVDNWNREVALLQAQNRNQDGDDDKDAPIKVIFGNKSDLNHMSQIDSDTHKKYSKDHGMQEYVGSAKTGDQVNQLFYKIAADLAGVKVTKT